MTLGYCRQHYYKQLKDKARKVNAEQQVRELIAAERKVLPRLGGRKLYYCIKTKLKASSIKLGRDGLFAILRRNDLLIKPKRSYIQTTMSRHWMHKYPNLVKEKTVYRPEQVWVSDITYIQTDEGNCYLNLVTDAFSRKIMGYAIAGNMEAGTMKGALQMAIKQRLYKDQPLIHHSDRGLQYCSREYVQLATDNGITISMTENGDPYENALAERMNRTLKEEFGLGERLPSREIAYKITREAIRLYNNRRPHLSLQMKTPWHVHQQKSRQPEATGIF